jgi:hypothetical protein
MPREARYGLHLFEVRVPHTVDPRQVLYCRADSITVTPAGAIILSAEVSPIEDEPDAPPSGIENAPALVLAPGQWYSAVQVTDADTGHQPYFFEGGFWDQASSEEDE